MSSVALCVLVLWWSLLCQFLTFDTSTFLQSCVSVKLAFVISYAWSCEITFFMYTTMNPFSTAWWRMMLVIMFHMMTLRICIDVDSVRIFILRHYTIAPELFKKGNSRQPRTETGKACVWTHLSQVVLQLESIFTWLARMFTKTMNESQCRW
jgi:hypothetical protein